MISGARGEIGIHARFRFWFRKECGFDPRRAHHEEVEKLRKFERKVKYYDIA